MVLRWILEGEGRGRWIEYQRRRGGGKAPRSVTSCFLNFTSHTRAPSKEVSTYYGKSHSLLADWQTP